MNVVDTVRSRGLYRSFGVVVVVGEMKLRLDDVRVLHLLVVVDRVWTLEVLCKELRGRYPGVEWYRQKVGRSLDKLRRNGLVEVDGYDTVREAVVVVADLKRHNLSTGFLWVEIRDVLRRYEDDPLEYLKEVFKQVVRK